MSIDPGIRRLLDTITAASGREALSEAKILRLEAGAPEIVTVSDERSVVAVGVAAPHRHLDGTLHWAIETAVDPGMSFREFEGSVFDATLDVLPDDAAVSAWSQRPALDAALVERGFSVARRLLHMVVSLPIDARVTGNGDEATIVRSFRMDDLDALIDVNRRAFAGHREAASLDEAEFEVLMGEPWFDAAGILVATRGDAVVGFCWTKVHSNGDGEIYRIAVDPIVHGGGLGRRLLRHGFGVLDARSDVERGTLWVEEANTAAIGLYESIGLRRDVVRTEYERTQPNR